MPIAVLASNRPRLATFARVQWDAVRSKHVLLAPEGVLVLNQTGVAILELCDGVRTVAAIGGELAQVYSEVREEEVLAFLDRLLQRRLVTVDD
ncbi:MAG: pyrroloquinoline quinone biosynthesis peptide chaperone PqqD [Herpetosiphon sp.]